ncbi:hypothetical protein BD626DRAFT_486795 [Schizophyllum amplum]|uniref:Uncharacterized protein n=1 Tax=Schizophyllum amplum TaxID=97359 RepID=A0A550CMU8_9AGAR|nr:hypothetical protein BD626DRAFT_486795 [Auriculariopsis ampla]
MFRSCSLFRIPFTTLTRVAGIALSPRSLCAKGVKRSTGRCHDNGQWRGPGRHNERNSRYNGRTGYVSL